MVRGAYLTFLYADGMRRHTGWSSSAVLRFAGSDGFGVMHWALGSHWVVVRGATLLSPTAADDGCQDGASGDDDYHTTTINGTMVRQ